MLVFSITKSQPIKVTIDDKIFVYVWFDKPAGKFRVGFKTPNDDLPIYKDNISLDELFKQRNDHE